VAEDHQEIREAMEASEVLTKSNPLSFESMQTLCNTYNKAVDQLVKVNISTVQSQRGSRRPVLKSIFQIRNLRVLNFIELGSI
jgi:hypothetical protein